MDPTSQEKKLQKISSFCESKGCPVESLITEITKHLKNLPRKLCILIDEISQTIKKIEIGIDIGIVSIHLIGTIFSLSGLVCPVVGIALNVLVLVALILKLISGTCELIRRLKFCPKETMDVAIKHKLNGLLELFKGVETCIDAHNESKDADDVWMESLISNVKLTIGLKVLGYLNSRIVSLISGDKDDWFTALALLKWFVRISTQRHSLLYRFQTCLRAKGLGQCIIDTTQAFIEKERKENQTFLASIFLETSLQNVGILTIFDPLEEKEITACLKKLCVHVMDLQSMLHNQVVIIKPAKNPSSIIGQPYLSSSVRSMKSLPGVENLRARLRFLAIENAFNFFYIKSYSDEFVYMTEDGKCKYARIHDSDDAKWRVILVNETSVSSSCFILCTKKRPEKIVYLENSFWGHVKGLENDSRANEDCLFTVGKHVIEKISLNYYACMLSDAQNYMFQYIVIQWRSYLFPPKTKFGRGI